MTRKVFLILLALVLALGVGLVACDGPEEEEEEEEGAGLATVSVEGIIRMGSSDGDTIGGAFYFLLSYPDSVPNTIGFLNIVADLNQNESLDTEEWIVENIPLFLDSTVEEGLLLSVWFDPGEQNLVVDAVDYNTWAIVSETEVDDLSDYSLWHQSQLPAMLSIWGENDPSGQTGEAASEFGEADARGDVVPVKKRPGVPDIAQKKNECGPTSTANSLIWLAKKHNFTTKLPALDDNLIKELMVAMTGSGARDFGGLSGNQLFEGIGNYTGGKGLPLEVKGGRNDANATGAKAFDFACEYFNKGCDVELLIWVPKPQFHGHWVTVVGCGWNGDRLFLGVHDPDDNMMGMAVWELDRSGAIVAPINATAAWAVAECPLVPVD